MAGPSNSKVGALKAWFTRKVVDPFKAACKEGAEPGLLARSVGVGFVLGLSPILGVSTLLAGLVLLATRLIGFQLHTPITLLANLLSIPVEVACILPFMRLGEWLLGAPHMPVAPVAIKDLLFNHPGNALKGLGHAVLGWVVASPFIMLLLFYTTRPLFAWAQGKYTEQYSGNTDDMEVRMLENGAGMLSADDEDFEGVSSTSASIRSRQPSPMRTHSQHI